LKQQDINSVFTDLIKGNERIIFKICYLYADNPANRQDLYQEIILQAWKGYKYFRGDAKFSTWLYQVALNTAITGIRREKKSVVIHTTDGLLPDMADAGNGNEQLEQLHAAVTLLNDIEKAIIMLYLDNKSYDEMQDILGVNSGALRVKMTRIKEKLRQITKNI
jgi:RNA polymerase sigma-70 factor (ECF subfamily)